MEEKKVGGKENLQEIQPKSAREMLSKHEVAMKKIKTMVQVPCKKFKEGSILNNLLLAYLGSLINRKTAEVRKVR